MLTQNVQLSALWIPPPYGLKHIPTKKNIELVPKSTLSIYKYLKAHNHELTQAWIIFTISWPECFHICEASSFVYFLSVSRTRVFAQRGHIRGSDIVDDLMYECAKRPNMTIWPSMRCLRTKKGKQQSSCPSHHSTHV